MKKGDSRWTVGLLVLALFGIVFIDLIGFFKWVEVGLIVLALINTIIGSLNKKA